MSFPRVPLREIATQVERGERPVADKAYRQIGVRLWGAGAYERETILGADTQYQWLTRYEEGDIVINKIWARNGSVAVVTSELAGSWGASEFPAFKPNREKLEPSWFRWFSRFPMCWNLCAEKSFGTSGQNRIRPEQFLEIEIPLPQPAEQRLIVGMLDEAAARMAQVRDRFAAQLRDAEALLIRAHLAASAESETSLSKLLVLEEEDALVEPEKEYPQVGIKSFGGGLFAKGAVSGFATTYPAFHRLYSGAVVLSQVKGWEGAIAVCPTDLDGWFVSPEYRTFRCQPDELLPEYFAHLCVTNWFWSRLAGVSRGAGARRDRVRPELFLQLEIPMPTVDEQRRLLRIFERLDSIKAHAAQITADLDALERSMLAAAFRGELVSAESIKKTASAQRPSDARTYIVQFVPALLQAADSPLSLEEVAQAYALLFKPDLLLPLIEATGGATAQRHFAELPPLDEKVFVQMLQELHRAGVIEQDAATDELHLGKVSTPPPAAAVAEDARLLAAILTLVPREAVRTMTRKLCPKPARELFAALS